MAEKRAERRRQMEEVAPGPGIGRYFDRNAWASTGGIEPGRWSWPRALLQVALAFALLGALTLVIEVDVTVFVGLAIAYVFLDVRGYQVHRRYLRGDAAPPSMD